MAQGMDMGQNRGGKGNAKVLKFPKRRYDGGTEIALIEAIEKKQKASADANRFAEVKAMEMKTLQDQNRKAWAKNSQEGSNAHSEPTLKEPVTLKSSQSEPIAVPKGTKKQRVMHAFIMGPLEICVGAVGLMTSILAIITFKQFKNEAMEVQSKQVLDDCVKTLNKGILDTVSMPNYLVKAIFES